MADRNDERLSPRASGGSGAPSFADFSSFREMMREEREAARAEREAAAAEARVERETAVAEQRRLMAEEYELKLQLAEGRRSRTAVVQNGTDERLSPRASGGSGAPSFADCSSFREMMREECEAARAEREAAAAEARVERETAAAEQRRLMAEEYELNLQLAEGRRSRTAVVQNGTAIGLDGRRHIESIRWMESESAPSPARSQASTSSRNGDSGAVPTQRGNGESQLKQINDVPLFDGTRAKFPCWKENFLCLAKFLGLIAIFTEGVAVPVADETMSIAALQEDFPSENIQEHFIAWIILSRAIACNEDRDTLRHASSPAAG